MHFDNISYFIIIVVISEILKYYASQKDQFPWLLDITEYFVFSYSACMSN